jgi:two-component system, OmpR family, sensor histidine kinase MtrB
VTTQRRPRRRAAALSHLPRQWRRSLQLRVVTTTLVLSGTVVLLLGLVLLDQVNRGLVDGARQAALAEAESGVEFARAQLRSADVTDSATAEATVESVATTLVRRGGAGRRYDIVLLSTSPGISGRQSSGIDRSSVPQELRTTVAEGGVPAWTYTRLVRTDEATGRTVAGPGIAVGAPLTTAYGSYQLFHVFPLSAEAETLGLVRRTLALGGAALVVLLAAIAFLVTRTVVTPVRSASRTASRLADGVLEERMTVRGEDDLARLASSFNSMAAGLQRQITQLEELSRVQQRFVSDVSHELRTPLTTVRMAADVLHAAREDFPAGVARSAELLQTELDRFERLLADLLEISRHDAGAAVLDAEPVDLAPLVRRVVDSVAGLAAGRAGGIEVVLPGEPVVAEVDPRRVERVLRNLVVNALEHGDDEPITVTLGADDDAAAVTVRDRGIGLRPGESALVFSRFWRADPSRARRTGGTGLGLSIALEDARLHAGWLQAWGEIGSGSVFRLTLPRRPGVQLTSSPLPLAPPDAEPETSSSAAETVA